MDALNTYKDLLRELDKWESPTFTIRDFNYFFPSSIREYITENYVEFDVVQKDLDDLRAILVLDHPLSSFVDNKAPLPNEYQHMLHLEVTLKVNEETKDHSVNDIEIAFPKRLKTGRKGYVQKNSYQKASVDYSHYQIDKDSLYVYSGTSEVQSGKMDYLKIPDVVYLNPDRTVDYTDPANNTVLQFPDHVVFEIIKKCRQIFLENIESPRYTSTLQENQLRKQEQ